MKTLTKKLGEGIHISAEELFPVLLLVLCSFLKTFSIALFDAGASVFFLETFLGEYIPQVLIGIAFLFFVLSFVLLQLKETTPQMPVRLMTAAGLASLVLYLAVPFPFGSAVLMSWKEGFRILMEASFWIIAFRFGVFHTKRKTLIAILLTQGIAVLAAALFIRLSADTASYAGLIPWACLFAFGAAASADVLVRNGSAPIQEHFVFSKQAVKRSGKERLQRRLYILFFATAGLLTFSAGIFNYYFLRGAVAEFGEQPEAFTVLYALVYALAGTLAIAGMLLSVRGHFSILSISLLFLAPLAFLMAAGGGYWGIFGLIAAAKAVHDLISLQSKEPVMQIIPRSISPRLDFRTNVMRKTVVEPAGLLLSGIFLLFWENIEGEKGTAALLLILAALSFIMIAFLRRAYIRIVLSSLRSYLWRGGRLMIFGTRLRRWIRDALNSPSPDEAIYALRVLEDARHPEFPCDLEQALHHPSEYVRLFALERIEAMDFVSTLEEVVACSDNDAGAAVRRAAVRVMCRLGGAEVREKAIGSLNDLTVREGALIGLLAAGAEGVFVAIDTLNYLSTSENPEDRALVAKVLGEARNPAFYRPLLVLFDDPDPLVRTEALIAAGKLLTPRLLPAVMSSFRYPELRETAVATLLQYRELAFPEIEKVLTSPENPIQFRILLAKTLGRIHSPAAESFLFDHLSIPDRRVRFNVLKSLVLMGYRVQGKKVTKVRLALYDEIEWTTGLLAALEDFSDQDDDRLGASLQNLRDAIRQEIEYAKERILLLLALLHPTPAILNLLNHFALTTEEEREEMAKIVDDILSGELRTLCLPLFQKISASEQLVRLRPHFLPPLLSFKDRLHDLLKTPPGEAADWTRASTTYVVGYFGDSSSVDLLIPLLSDYDAIVRETAIWALGRILSPEEAARLMRDSVNDPVPPVARMARFVVDGTGRPFF